MTFDVAMRITGSALAIIAYFVVLHISVAFGVLLHFIGDAISVPYFVKTKSWDVVIMIAFLLMISVSHLI